MAKKIARKKDSTLSGRGKAVTGLEHNVDRIREILFGGAMQDYDERFELLQAQLDELAATTDSAMKDTVDSVKKQIAGLQSSLEDVVRDLGSQVRDVVRAQEKLQINIEKMLQTSLKETVTTMRREAAQDRDTMNSAISELRQAQEDIYDDLSERKIDRQELVRLFMEFINANTGR